MAPFSLHFFNQGLCYSSWEISLEVDGLRKICFESTYIGAVFVIKIYIVLTGERLNNAENSSFH